MRDIENHGAQERNHALDDIRTGSRVDIGERQTRESQGKNSQAPVFGDPRKVWAQFGIALASGSVFFTIPGGTFLSIFVKCRAAATVLDTPKQR
jgi:hypothetical protein